MDLESEEVRIGISNRLKEIFEQHKNDNLIIPDFHFIDKKDLDEKMNDVFYHPTLLNPGKLLFKTIPIDIDLFDIQKEYSDIYHNIYRSHLIDKTRDFRRRECLSCVSSLEFSSDDYYCPMCYSSIVNKFEQIIESSIVSSLSSQHWNIKDIISICTHQYLFEPKNQWKTVEELRRSIDIDIGVISNVKIKYYQESILFYHNEMVTILKNEVAKWRVHYNIPCNYRTSIEFDWEYGFRIFLYDKDYSNSNVKLIEERIILEIERNEKLIMRQLKYRNNSELRFGKIHLAEDQVLFNINCLVPYLENLRNSIKYQNRYPFIKLLKTCIGYDGYDMVVFNLILIPKSDDNVCIIS